ncbi:hypothetical protein GCM10023191_022740 [Actinoallomurus oryzae]|uniref:Uncharacterized protein n=1 Tax=Actinoallomurus oryzae TaxID=502180 RepID=A0ABP8PS48_9ACTN
MPDEAWDLLDRHAAVGEQGREAMPHLPRGQLRTDQAGLDDDPAELPPHVPRAEAGAGSGGEYEIVVLPLVTGGPPGDCLPLLQALQRGNASLGELEA